MKNIQEILKTYNDNLASKGAKLIAVSKTHPAQKVEEAYKAGQIDFGENKVQELVEKAEQLPKDIQWHLIGHLQRNKVKYIAPFVHLIHSIDSFKLLREVEKEAKKADRIIPCLLQVHIAKESSKFGFDELELFDMLKMPEFVALENVRIEGLMGMATFTEDEELIHKEFQSLKSLSLKIASEFNHIPFLQMKELSMGMSSDYSIAIEEGSTMVRIGSAIFGERDYGI
jgi:pyridoxal phosphate enzyme (YggS family)